MTRKLSALTAVVVVSLVLVGCADEDPTSETSQTRTASNGDVYNDTDVAFATGMIPHHAQALSMVDLTANRELEPEVEQLAEDVAAAQGPEIRTMTEWLEAWDQPVPEADMGSMDMDSAMPGMMSGEEMTQLEDAPAAQFQQLWLEMMLEHHRGAVAMAETEQSDGEFGPAVTLAEKIESSQRAEIDRMEELLGS